MDRNRTRELVYCHQCENEWYRDEHGIICPECQSDFTEIIEDSNRDPRDDDAPEHGFHAPDPDEGDIDDFFNWQPNGPGQPPGGRLQGTFTRNMNLSNQAGAAQGGGGLFGGLLGSAIQGILSGQQPRHQASHGQGAGRDTPGAEGQGNPQTPGSPQQNQPQWAPPGTTVRHGHGPGYSFTITTSGGMGLAPRDANGPQPFQGQPAALQQMLDQMVRNIGVAPMGIGPGFGGGGMYGGGMYGGGMHGGPGGPTMMGIGAGPPLPMADLFQLLGMGGGQHGDAVYTQEALDRVISQLMEQHQSGNAPPPASTEAIESLPKRPVTQKDVGDNGKADCSICMDEAEMGSMVTELPCGHWFHYDCIKAWLTEHDTCPHCRQGIMPKDQPNNDRARDPSQAPHYDMHTAEQQRAPSSQGEGGSSGGMFSRMRQAFGGNRGENRESQGQ